MNDEAVSYPLDRQALEEACEVEYIRAGGPGGQHRNKRYTGVRLHHRPSGVTAQATERRSQALNLETAYARLAAALRDLMHVDAPRVPSRPSRAQRRARLVAKRRRGEKKALRRRPRRDDD